MTLPAPELSRLIDLHRVKGMALRHVFLYMQSWPRLVEMMYWPMLNMVMFGYVSLSIIRYTGHVGALDATFLVGVMLAEIVTRSSMAIMVMYMEEVWSRNLGHLFASPLRLRDFIGSLMGLSAVRSLISIIPAYILVAYLFDYSILKLGIGLPLYAVLLCFNGWWYGILIMSMLFRFGLAAEWLGWMCNWLLLPFMAAYYPVSILPTGLQAISWSLPGTYVFESMKQQLATGVIRYDYLGIALGLNLVYFALAAFALSRAYRSARQTGGLLQMGE